MKTYINLKNSVLLFIGILIFLNSKSQEPIRCATSINDAQEWYQFFVDSIYYNIKDTTIAFTDGSGGSIVINNNKEDFGGNWLSSGACKICFDYKVDYNSDVPLTLPGNIVKMFIYTGPEITSHATFLNATRAIYVEPSNAPQIPDNVWVNYCRRIDLCTFNPITMPSNNDGGYWQIIKNGVVITDPESICSEWNLLITDITGIILATDYNEQPSEIVSMRKFCWYPCDSTTEVSTCCDSITLSASLTENNGEFNLNLNSGTTQIQEVEVSMVDYHATYSEPGCQPVNMDAGNGHIGYMNTTTNNLSSLNLVAAQNNSHVLEWMPGSPAQLNHTVNFSVKPPSVINVSCCGVNFSFCIKVRVKDINCNVCEQILCYPSSSTCHCGSWGNIFYQNVNGNKVSLTCGDKIRDILNCKSPLKVNFTYFCNPDTCATTIDYKIYETATNTLISTVSGLSGVLTTLITPSVTGDYYLLATAICGNKVCDECKIYFTTRCNVVDCCKDSYWKEKPIWNQNEEKLKIDCENPKIFEISEERKNCDTPITIGGTFICNSSNCPAKVVYILYDGQGNLVNTSNSSLTIPVTLPNGEYNVKIEAYCGDKICQECKFKFIKKCEVSSCDCGKWKDNKITVNWRDRRGNQTTTVNCDNLEPYQLSDLCSNVPVTGNFSDFVCIPTNCQAKYSWVVLDQNNNAVASDNDTTSTSFSFNINAAGNYQFVITSKCGDKRCETCRIRFSVKNVINCN